jgi:hypothetical protein
LVSGEEVFLGQSDCRVLTALRVTARQSDQVRVVVLIEKKVSEVERIADVEISAVAVPAVPAFRRNLCLHSVSVDGYQAGQLGAHHHVDGPDRVHVLFLLMASMM